MKKFTGSIFLHSLLAAVLCVAGPGAFAQGMTVTIRGKAGGNSNGLNKIYIVYPSSMDSTVIKDGQFSIQVPVKEPVTQVGIVTEYELANPNVGMGRYKMLFLAGQGTLNVDIDDIQKGAKTAKLSGLSSAVEFDQYEKAEAAMHKSIRAELEPVYGIKKSIDPRDPTDMEYVSEYDKLTASKIGDMLKNFVKTYPASYVSAYELSEQKSNIKDDKKVKEIYDLLTPGNQQSFAGTDVGEYLKGAAASIVGKQAPDFELSRPDGQPFQLSSLKGKYVILDFWASWCKPCIASIPEMRELYNKYKSDKFDICSISTDKDRGAWILEVKKQRLPWTQVLDDQQVSLNKFNVEGIPTVYLIGPDGKIILKQLGLDASSGNSLQKKLEEIFPSDKTGKGPEMGKLPAEGVKGAPPAGTKLQRAEPAKVKE